MTISFPNTASRLFDLFGNKARLVGGYVRDLLLGIQSSDIDVAVALTPEELIQFLNNHHIPFKATGLTHGGINICFDHQLFQLTCLRKDIQCDGRHAQVSFGVSFEEDAKRRDFTFNALYLDQYGTLYDYFNGENDLKNGIVRFIGDPHQRIQEDYLRILRFFRMYCYYSKDTTLDLSMLHILKAYKDNLKKLSIVRIKDELFKIFLGPKAKETLAYLSEGKFFEGIKPFEYILHSYHALKGQTTLECLASLIKNSPSLEEDLLLLQLSKQEKKIIKSLI